jgi:hypothetical protein
VIAMNNHRRRPPSPNIGGRCVACIPQPLCCNKATATPLRLIANHRPPSPIPMQITAA